jgi:dihydropteroate synthase
MTRDTCPHQDCKAAPCRWAIKGGAVLEPAPFLLVGIVNVTPESFFDGGRYLDPGKAVAHATELAAQGAHVLDIGGESTRPYSEPVEAREEIERILPVIDAMAGKGVPLSVDTTKSEVARAALDAGAAIVNDVSACRFDPALADLLADRRPGYVLMHSQGRPREMQVAPKYRDVVEEILSFFEERMAVLTRAGLPEEHIVLDPGIGFGKLLEHNVAILKGIGRFLCLGRPVYIGLSNKSFLQHLLGLGPAQRGEATMVATAIAAREGARVHRVHDVARAGQALALIQAVYRM